MVDAVVDQGPAQRLGHVILPDHFGERLRPVAPVERQRGLPAFGRGGPPRRRQQRHHDRGLALVLLALVLLRLVESGLLGGLLHVGGRRLDLGRVVGIDRDLGHLVLVEVDVEDGQVVGLVRDDELVGLEPEQVGPVLLEGGRVGRPGAAEESAGRLVVHGVNLTGCLGQSARRGRSARSAGGVTRLAKRGRSDWSADSTA